MTTCGDGSSSTTRARRPAGARRHVHATHIALEWSVAALARGERTARDRAPRRDSGQHVPPLTRRNFLEFRLSETALLPSRRPARGHDDRRHPPPGRGRGGEARDSPGARGGLHRDRRVLDRATRAARRRADPPPRGADRADGRRSRRDRARHHGAEAAGRGARVPQDEQAALSRVGRRRDREAARDPVRHRDRGARRLLGADAANLVRFGPDSTEGQIVGKERAGSRDRRARTHGDHGRRTAHPRPSHGGPPAAKSTIRTSARACANA